MLAAVVPVAVLALTWGSDPRGLVLGVVGVTLVLAILMGVHHAEVIAHRVGDPFGAVILALAVTVLEAGLIIMLMVDATGPSTLARDTLFSAVMIVANLMVGVSLVIASMRHHIGRFRRGGTGGMLATLMTLTTLTLVLPSFTSSEPGPIYSGSQLAFASIAALALWGVFVFTQTVRHRDAFLPVKVDTDGDGVPDTELDAVDAASLGANAGEPPARPYDPDSMVGDEYPDDRMAFGWHLLLLVLALVSVVGLAKVSSGAIEDAVGGLDNGQALVGIIVAAVVLLPEGLSAAVAAWRNHLQTSLNLALGSGIASIGLTIPTVAVASTFTDVTLVLGLSAQHLVLLFLTFLLSTVTLASGRGSPLQGAIHLVVFASFVFLTIFP